MAHRKYINKTVNVELDLDEFSDYDLQLELEARGYFVAESEPELSISDFSDEELKEEVEDRDMYMVYENFENYDIELLLGLLGNPKPGSDSYNVAEKLRNIYYGK